MRGTFNWTDYTAEADIAFMDPGTDGSTAYAYILGMDCIIIINDDPYGGAYIAGVGIENDGGGGLESYSSFSYTMRVATLWSHRTN
ncbi:MAG: hypothetical protein U9N36_01405 [Euryarchaeota archaeon]|nr:hypothetical protein [Euryarchaeota archaeon]